MSVLNFLGKIIIKGKIRTETGLHIGSAVEKIEIGDVDSIVIKDPLTGYPYIPGSSLKGKMRSLLEWKYDKVQENKGEPCKCGDCEICKVFGVPAEKSKEPGRLIVRDAFPTRNTLKEWKENLGEDIFTEIKWENTINRITARANPRAMERVPKGSEFEFEMIFDVFTENDVEDLLPVVFEGMRLLQDSYLGGSGTRGYGKISFIGVRVTFRKKEYYQKNVPEEEIFVKGDNEKLEEPPEKIKENLLKILEKISK